MEHLHPSATLAGAVVAVALLAGCGPRDDQRPSLPGAAPAEIVQATGTIRFVPLEGGFYGIIADDGTRYDPIHLPEALKKDGQRVRFEGKVRHDLASIHMWGILIEITRISAL